MAQMETPNNDSTTTVTGCATTPNINDLPEDLILHILSFLPTLDTITTSLVSKKWYPFWSLIPALNFSYSHFPPYNSPATTRQFFAEFVDRALVSRSYSPLVKFRLDFIYEDRFGCHVDSWVRYAIRNRAIELHLDFYIDKSFHEEEPHLWDAYDFPFSALRNGKVRVLRLTRCELTLPCNMKNYRLWSLKCIYLDQIYLCDQMVMDLISGCPNLEVLEIESCRGLDTLKVCSTKLKEMELRYFGWKESEISLEFDCPNLVSLSIIWIEVKTCLIKNLSSLVQFRTLIGHEVDRFYGYWNKTVRMLDQVPHIRRLQLQNWWLKLAPKKVFSEGFVLYNLRHLELQTGYTQYDLLGMAALLELAPNIESMILDFLCKLGEDEILSEELLNKPINLSMPSLKEVKMKQFTGTEEEAHFLTLLKKQGVVLEKIVIVPATVGDIQYPPITLRKRAMKD